MIEIEYGVPTLVILGLLDAQDSPAGLTLENAPSLAAADAKIISNRYALTEMAAENVAFTSGSVEPTPGDTISGATSGSTAIYIGSLLTSGTWAGGDAAGTMWVYNASGAFQAENLDNDTTSGTNFATIGADLTDAAIAAVGRTIAMGVTGTEATMRMGMIELRDADATEVYLETYIPIRTLGHASAAFNLSGAIHDSINDASAAVTGWTTTTSQGSLVLYGVCEITSGALEGETRFAKWTGTTLTTLGDPDMDSSEKQFSAAPANSVTFTFYPIKGSG